MVFSLNLGISFAILVLYVSYLEALAIVFVLVTAAVVAASTTDLKELEKDKGLLGFAILCAIFVYGASYYITPFFAYLFYSLVALNVVTLVGYVLMKRMPKYEEEVNSF